MATRWRVPLTLAGASLFVAGIALSVSALDVTSDQLALWPFLPVLVLLTVFTLAGAAIGLQLAARAVGRRIGFREAFALSGIARIAEVLPLPGGAMVRGAALMRAGARLGESARIVALTGTLTLAMTAMLGGAALAIAGHGVGYAVLAAGMAGSVATVVIIARRAGIGVTLSMVGIRLAIIAIGIARIGAAFAAVGYSLDPWDTALFVICATLGTAVTFVPAGLGVSESIGAALALLIDVSPAAAFLALGINRLVGLAFSGGVAFLFGPTFIQPRESES